MATVSSTLRFLSPKLPFSLSIPFPSTPHHLLLLPKTLLLPCSPISFQRLTPNHHPRLPNSLPTSQRDADLDPSTLPSALQEIIALFRSVSDPRAKYQQLLHYGSKLPPLDPSFKTDENRVRGCVSRVWVRAFRDPDDPLAVRFEADSDAALTRGLAALLVLGLSGSTPEVIACVPAEFVLLLGIRQSLSESRNNGFLNMLKLMQRKALEIGSGEVLDGKGLKLDEHSGINQVQEAKDSNLREDGIVFSKKDASLDWNGNGSFHESLINGKDENGGELGGRGGRIREKLEKELAPVELEVEDISYMHAGHAAVRGSGDGETHFNVKVVSDKFEGKSLVKRHRLVYDLLQNELQSGLHALSIVAKTPSEVQN